MAGSADRRAVRAGVGLSADGVRAAIEGARVLITGGAGFDRLDDRRPARSRHGVAEIVVLDNLVRGRTSNLDDAMARGRGRPSSRATSATAAVLAEVMAGIDVVFHQAAIRITQCAEEPRLAPRRDGRRARSTCSRRPWTAGVGKVVAASSASVYGMADEFPTAETHHPYDNRTLYGAAKVFNEGLLRSFHDMYGLDYVALRYFNVYGPRMDIHGVYTEVLVRWMERIARRRAAADPRRRQPDDGLRVQSTTSPGPTCSPPTTAVTDEVFNVASGDETSLRELAAALQRVMGSRPRAEYGPERAVNPVRPPPGRHRAARTRPRLRGRGRPRGRPAAPRRLVAATSGRLPA